MAVVVAAVMVMMMLFELGTVAASWRLKQHHKKQKLWLPRPIYHKLIQNFRHQYCLLSLSRLDESQERRTIQQTDYQWHYLGLSHGPL
mmetsp:Transcript_27012/g.22288  ORF Transcript_27012/g.22288 Transcript_27012/m.22288 type:complete len:88 (+) Transcript_27012:207-470(+)